MSLVGNSRGQFQGGGGYKQEGGTNKLYQSLFKFNEISTLSVLLPISFSGVLSD